MASDNFGQIVLISLRVQYVKALIIVANPTPKGKWYNTLSTNLSYNLALNIGLKVGSLIKTKRSLFYIVEFYLWL